MKSWLPRHCENVELCEDAELTVSGHARQVLAHRLQLAKIWISTMNMLQTALVSLMAFVIIMCLTKRVTAICETVMRNHATSEAGMTRILNAQKVIALTAQVKMLLPVNTAPVDTSNTLPVNTLPVNTLPVDTLPVNMLLLNISSVNTSLLNTLRLNTKRVNINLLAWSG